jgi:hemerythrin-like domain-containing protein
MLKKDHREVEELLTKLQESSPGPRRRGNVDKLEKSLKLHMQIEEQLVYPLVAREVGQKEAKEANIEHDLVRDGLQQLRKLVDKPGFGAVVEMLKAGIKHHVKEEEKEMFPDLKRSLDRETLAEVGDRAAAMKGAKAKGGRSATRRGTRAPARKTTRSTRTAKRKSRTTAGRSASYARNPAGASG